MLFRKIGIDRAVLLGILTRLWSIVAGLVTLLLIVYKFSPQLQGYYYTFFSIIAFQFLIELGLGNVIIQFTSHEWSRLSLDKDGNIIGDNKALSRLQSLAQFFFRWYYFASIILTLGLALCGLFVFSKNHDGNINWALPWFSLCITNGVAFCLIPIWSLLEGCNQVSRLYLYRLIQGVCLNLSLWAAILLGVKLWALVISNIVILVCAGVFILHRYKPFLKVLLFSIPLGPGVKWRQEVLPLQWRTTISWLIGPFAFNLFVPVLFKYHGSVIAGQMGMTLNLISAVATMPSSWLSPRIPQFGILIARKRYKELDKLFWSTAKIFTVIAIVGAGVAWFIVYALNAIRHPLAARFLPLLPAGIFIFAQIILVMAVPFATYLRIHKKEPLLFVSVASGISTGLATLILGKYYSAIGMAIGFFLITLIIVPIVFVIWYRCKIEWHKDGYIDDLILDSNIKTNGLI